MSSKSSLFIKQRLKKSKQPSFSAEKLRKMISEVLERNLNPILETKGGKGVTLTWDGIPSIAVSEIGWSNMQTTAEGKEIPSKQRASLINYLKNIKGSDLKEKIASLSNFYGGDLQLTPGATPGQRALEILSYLVFFKTLTVIMTNFNPASAGFSFESFLAVLLGGEQITASQKGAQRTIADIRVGDVPISLKLYAEKSVKVGGSWRDLVTDLALGAGLMRYVVGMKEFTGEALGQEGKIGIYQYDFTIDNVAEIISASTRPRIMELPASFFEDPSAALIDKLPAQTTITVPQLKEVFDKFIREGGEYYEYDKGGKKIAVPLSAAPTPELAEDIINHFKWGEDLGLFNKGKWQQPLASAKVSFYLDDLASLGKIEASQKTPLYHIIRGADAGARKFYYNAEKRFQGAIKELNFYSAEESAKKYGALASPEEKKNALLSSRGYLFKDEFHINRGQVYKIAEQLGVIEIGFAVIEKMLAGVADQLNTAVYEIITEVDTLTTSINQFFTSGMEDDPAADKAIKSSETVAGKTEELRPEGPASSGGPDIPGE